MAASPHHHLRAKINELAAARLDPRTLRLAAVDLLAGTLDFDHYVFVLTDPVTAVGVDPLAVVPPGTHLPQLIRAKYLTRTNRWTDLIGRRPPVASLTAAADPEPLWSVLEPLGVVDVASMVFADPYGCWAFLDLWRSGSAFPSGALQLLGDIAQPLTTALRQAQARTFAEPPHTPVHVEPAVVLVGNDLEIMGHTGESGVWLDRLLPPAAGAAAVPAGVYNVAAALLAAEAGVNIGPPSARAHLVNGLWLTIRAARIPAVAEESGPIAVSIEPSSSAERLELVALGHALTPRERETLGRLDSGGDTRMLARAMAVSELTVQDHLKSIFAKTGTQSRVQLLSRISGHRYT